MFETPLTQQQIVTKIIKSNDSYLILALQNGLYLGWDLNKNPVAFDNAPGLDNNRSFTSIVKHGPCILSGDNAGMIQIRNLDKGFA
jgi:hypothetical protein